MAFFIPDPNFAKQAEDSEEYRAGLADAAQGAAQTAESLAHAIMPRDSSVQIVIEQTSDGVFIVNRAYGAWIDEVGSINNPPYAPLRRGVQAAGLRLAE